MQNKDTLIEQLLVNSETATAESANVYTTLLGETIDLDALDPTRHDLAIQIVALQNGRARDDYVKEARQLITGNRPYSTGDGLLNGPVGAIYRDGFYRLSAPDDLEKRKAFVNRLRYHPARLLIDEFLRGWSTHGQLALDAKLEPLTLAELFRSVLDGTSCELDIHRLALAFERISISPNVHRPDNYDDRVFENPFDQRGRPPSLRESEAMKMVSKATRISSVEERRSFLEQEVARIYRLQDYHVVQDFVNHVSGLIEE